MYISYVPYDLILGKRILPMMQGSYVMAGGGFAAGVVGVRESFFKARILLADAGLNASDVPVRLMPRMTVSTEIKVENRTVMSYFLYPVLRGLDEAIREPN